MKMITDLQDNVVTPNVMQLGDKPLTDIGVEPGSVLRDDWDGVSDAITMQAQSEEKARKMQQLVDVAFAKAGDKAAAKRVESDALLGWALTAEAAADAENTEDVLGTQLARRYGTGDPGTVWDAMNASADYEYEQMPAWNTRAEGMRLVWQRFQKMAAGKKAAADAAQAAVNERLKGLEAFVDGKEAKRDEGGKLADDAITDGRLWELVNQGVLELADVQRAQKVREFMRRYVVPLGKRAEMDERMRGLDGLRDEVYELIGEDKDTARLVYESLMRWAGEQRGKNDTGAGDEFQVAVGKKLSDWARAVDEVAPLALLSVGAPGPVAPALVEQAVGTYEARRDKNERQRLSSGILRAGIDEAMKVQEGGWWQSVKNAPRVAAAMAGDTLPYLVPFVGAGLGTADAFVRGFTSGIDAKVLDAELGGNQGGWESRKAMGNAAMLESGIQALVELMPWSRVGGKGLAASVGRKMKAVTGGKYVPGALSRALARGTQKSVTRALVAEFGANVVTEGLLEPIAQGALTLTAEGVMDLAGVEHGRSKSFSEAFAELGEIWEPEQLAGFLMFSAALTGPAYGQARKNVKLYQANVKKFAKNAEAWETLGLSRAEAEEAAGAEDPVERGRELVAEGWKNDPEGMHARLVQKHKELKDSGRTIVFAGVNVGGFDADTVKLLGEAWRASQKRFHLPEVELLGDGRVRLTREEIPGVIDAVDLTLTEEQADAFLFQELNRLDVERMKDWQKAGGNVEEYENLQTKLAGLVDVAMGDVAVDAAVAEGSMDVEEMGKGLPEELRGLIKQAGGINLGVAKKISEWAIGQMEALEAGGMSRAEAREQVASEDGGATLGMLAGTGASMQKRLKAAGDMSLRSALNRRRGGRRVAFNGRSVLGSVLVHARGGATGMNAVEDISESVFDMMVQGRTEAILENQAAARKAAGEAERPATLTAVRDAEEQAWKELAEVASKAREALLKVDPDLAIEEVDGSRLNTIEALSTMAMSRYLGSGVLPRWMSGLVDVMRKNVQAAAAVVQLQKAMVALGEQDAGALKDLLEFLDDAGVQVGKSLAGARVEAVADRIRELARWHAGADAAGPGGVGGMSVSQAQEEVLEEEDEIQQNDKAREAVAAAKPADAAKREDEADREMFERDTNKGIVPERMKGVFVGDAAVYSAAGDFWCGEIEKGKLSDGTEQVKVGEKGKHGVIAGKELTGRFVNDTDPIRVWKRKNGELWVISGRHRFAKRMEDETGNTIMCYVYEETEERDEKWARMKDYEQNMRDDQADEVTCAVYARETGKTEMEMFDEGLTRKGSRSKRGIFIGQHAREELWTRFRNGEITPMDAELVCKLTSTLEDQSNVAEIQAHCCGLLKAGKSWDYIGASVQLMASAEARQAEQMLLDLGADFTANLERMARWVELCRKAFREAIDLLKDEKRRVKKGAKASRLGLGATMTDEKREEMLGDLVAMDAKFEMIGSYPELVAEAKMWDGDESKFADPVAMYLERVEAMQEEGLQEEQARREAEEATGMFNWSSSLTQRQVISDLRSNPELKQFMDCVDSVESTKDRKLLNGVEYEFGKLSEDIINAVQAVLPDKIDLHGAKHTLTSEDVWHMYRGHCLDSFIYDNQISITYDDIRMIPDIVRNYDSVKVEKESGKWSIVFLKQYGNLTYKYVTHISRKHDSTKTRHIRLKTGWLIKGTGAEDDFTSRQSQAQTASHFPRTAMITQLEEFIKLNYGEEARKIAEYAKNHDRILHAPNGIISNLTPVQWLAVRLQSFKDWFGDWENDPENASKAVDENGEPKVYYHHTNAEFTEFLHSKRGKTDAGWLGAGFYFYGIEDEGKGYGKNVMECFLNVREPYYASDDDMFRLSEADSIEESEAFTESLIEDGYDGVYYNGDLRQEMMVFESNQIKSATDNRGTFDGNNPDITYSVTGGKNLAAVHSLSAENFLAAVELGGMPMPSVAVTRLDRPYEWGGAGAINLIGKPELVDPRKGADVFSSDAWAGQFPAIEHRNMNDDDLRAVTGLTVDAERRYGYIFEGARERIMQQKTPDDLRRLLGSDFGKMLFALSQGYAPKPKMRDVPVEHSFVDVQLAKETRNMWVNRDEIKAEYKEAFADAVERALERWLDTHKAEHRKLYRSLYEDVIKDLRELERPLGVWFRLKRSIDGAGRREPDKVANMAMLARYADKHKRAFAEWVDNKVGMWLSKEAFIRDNGKPATLDNVTAYMLKNKGRNKESFVGFGTGMVRAGLSDKMRSLEDIQARRERLTDSKESKESKAKSEALMYEFADGVRECLFDNGESTDNAYDYAWEALSKVKGAPNGDKVRRALRRVFSYSGDALDSMLEDSELIKTGVEAVAAVRAELEDYMEAIPQRAVKMNEWEYAVMPVGLKKNKAVMAALREHGIKPVWHDGTEEGRRSALAGLVDDPVVSFSVIGPKAATWSKYVDRAFAGRDDGMWRAEIDASGAKLKWEDLHGKNVAAYRRIVAGWDELPEEVRKAVEAYAEEVYDWQDESERLDSVPESEVLEHINKVQKMRDAIKPKREEMRSLLNKLFVEHGGSAGAVLNMKSGELDELAMSLWGPYVESKVERMLDLQPLWNGGMRLADVMDYPELYEAYPELADVVVRYVGMETANGYAVYGNSEREIHINRRLDGEWEKIHSVLLHEIQHHIQDIEGWAKGGSPAYARKLVNNRAAMGDLDAMSIRKLSDMELYARVAGEIEARNVQHRMDWSADKRAATPFNETLEYPGEALVTYSLTGAGAAGRRALEESGDEYVANRLLEAWQKNLEKWSVLHAGKADTNSAMRAVMEMEGLVKATYDVVQDDVKLGRLYMLQRWAMVYARMVESGELPPKGALKGPAYENFVERLTAEQRKEMRRGMSREQAEELVKELGVARLEGAMEKVARECMRAAERHLKKKETRRVKRLLEAAWPTREEGKMSPRGKLAAREYRRLEWIKKVMELSAEDKYKETQRIIREIDELPQELVGYEERKAELEGKLAALDPKQADYVERKAELDKAMRELNPNEVGYDEAKAELEDQLNWLHVFGGWADMDVSQARKAAKALEDLLLRGYTEWERKVQRERERTRRVADEISAHFKAPWYATRMERKQDADAMGTNKPKMVKGLRWGLMGYAQMMLALRKKLGKVFCDRQRKTLAEAHRNLLQAQKDLQDWSAMELQKITGLTGAALEQWIASNNQNVNTGIMMQQVRSERIRMSAKEVDRLGAMSEKEYEAWRDGELAKAEADGRAVVLPTAEELLVLRGLRLERPGRKWLEVERTEQQAVELVATKEAMLYAVLLFEQPDYEHLVEAHGLSWADVDTMKKLIGPKLLRWGYAMRRHLNENGELLAAKYEAWNGTPFGRRANYFRGVFDVNKLKPETDIIDGNAGANSLGGSKYSILIPRRYHRQQINWQVGASQVFMLTMNEQNNYIHTQHITREWRQLLSRKGFADGLSAEIGANAVNMIKLHLDVIDAAPRADAAMTSLFGRLVQGVMKATAISSLALNVYSYMKQVSCLLNAIVGGYVPDAAVKQSGVYQVLTYSGIGAGELVRSYARVLSGRGAVSFTEMTGSAVIQSRIQSGGKRVADALMMRTGQALPNAVGRAGEVAGEWALEQMDMIDRRANTVAAMVVADAVYRKLSATEGGKEAGDKWVRAQAIEAAGLMVDLVAQPKLRTQKGLWASHGGFFGGVGNFFYMFRSESLAKIGTYLAQISSGDYAKALGGFMSMGVGLWLVGLVCSFLKGQIDGDDLDEEEDLLKFARKSVTEVVFGDLASLPIVGGGIGAAKAAVGGTWHYVQDPLQMILPVSDLWKRPKQLYKAVDNEGIWSFKAMRALCNCLRAGGNASGWGMGTGSAVTSSAAGIILGAAVLGNAGRFVLDVAERVTEE